MHMAVVIATNSRTKLTLISHRLWIIYIAPISKTKAETNIGTAAS